MKRELRNLDAVQLKSIESERKQEIAQLAREREQIKLREDELLAEVAKLEDRISKREQSFRQQQDQVEDYYIKNLNQKKDAHKNEQMQLAQYRGQRAARLKAQRQKLENDRAALAAEMIQKGFDSDKYMLETEAGRNGENDNTSPMIDLHGTATDKEELVKMIEHVHQTIGSETVRLKKLRAEHHQNMQDDQAAQIELDSQLGEIAGMQQYLKNTNGVSLSEQASTLAHNLGSVAEPKVADNDGKASSLTATAVSKGDKRLEMRLQGALVDELDKIVAGMDTGMRSTQRADSDDKVEPTQVRGRYLQTPDSGSRNDATKERVKQQSNKQSGEVFARSATNADPVDPVLADIAALKADYIKAGMSDPNTLAAIQALEREYGHRRAGSQAARADAISYRLPIPQQQRQPDQSQPFEKQPALQSYSELPPQMATPFTQAHALAGNMGANSALNVNVQLQWQMRQMHQLQQQQLALDRQRMQREMEEILRDKDEDLYGKQRREINQMVSGITAALAAGAGNGGTGDSVQQSSLAVPSSVRGVKLENAKGIWRGAESKQIIDEDALRQLSMLAQGPLKNSELYRMHMQHLSELTKTRLEMDKLEQQQALVRMQNDLKRKQAEHEKDAEHELYMAEKRRQLRAARIQRILAKELPGGNGVSSASFSRVYEPDDGLFIWFDFALGVPARFRKLQLVYCFAIDSQVQTKPKALPFADCEPESKQHQKAIFGGTRKVSQVGIASGTRLVLEVQSVSGPGDGGANSQLESIGWTALDLFVEQDGGNGRLELNAGMHKLPLQRGTINWNRLGDISLPSSSHITIYVRIVGSSDNGQAKIMSIEPSLVQYNYTYPRCVHGVPRGGRGFPQRGDKNGRGLKKKRRQREFTARACDVDANYYRLHRWC